MKTFPFTAEVASMKARIARADTPEALDRCDRALTRLWDLGIFTVSQLQRLDARICDARENLKQTSTP